MTNKNIYRNSLIVKKLRELQNKKLPLQIAFLDIDGTMTGDSAVQYQTRKALEEHGYVLVFVSNRPYELILSNAARKKSSLPRPQPHTHTDAKGIYYLGDPAEGPHFEGLLDTEIIADSSALHMLVEDVNGIYREDSSILPDIPLSSNEWRKQTIELVKMIDKSLYQFRAIEDIENYYNHKADVIPIDYRIQIDFKNEESGKFFIEKLHQLHQKKFRHLPVVILDDSDPQKDMYSLYIMPIAGIFSKSRALNHILLQLSKTLDVALSKFHVFAAGDALPDIYMGLEGPENLDIQFLLTGGSRLASFMSNPHELIFMNEDLSHIKSKLRLLSPGIYQYNTRRLYIGDILYPGKNGPLSILSFLADSKN